MIASGFPNLKHTLTQAQMHYTPAGFVQYAVQGAIFVSLILLVIGWLLLKENPWVILILLLCAPVLLLLSFMYLMQFPGSRQDRGQSGLTRSWCSQAGHMLIELQSGVPLFDALIGISRDYGPVSDEFNKVVEKVTLGIPLGQALHTVAEDNPSPYFNRMIMQMVNSLSSGSDVAVTLEAALNQISKEQVLELRAYGQKLNPLVMFYMIMGIIMPSLGVAFLIILSSLLGGKQHIVRAHHAVCHTDIDRFHAVFLPGSG